MVTKQAAISFLTSLVMAAAVGALLFMKASGLAYTANQQQALYEIEAANPTPVIVCRDGLIVMVNPAAEKALGKTQDELVGHPAVALVPEEYRARHLASNARLKSLPIGESGSSRYILPAVVDGVKTKWWVTVVWKVEPDGSLLTTARLVNFVLSPDTPWLDVETMKLYTADIHMKEKAAP